MLFSRLDRDAKERKTHKKIKAQQAPISLFTNSRGTISARSCCHHSIPRKAPVRTTHKTRQAMTEPSLHGFVTPPHCRARKKQIKPASKTTRPMKSNCCSFSFSGLPIPDLAWTGVRKKKSKTPAATPPMGRLM